MSRNGSTGSMGRYSFMSGFDNDLYKTLYHKNTGGSAIDGWNKNLYPNLYHKINLSSPEMDDMASQAAPGASMAAQARAAGGQDIFRNIQAMREAEYKKEEADGQISSEFSGIRRPGNLAGALGYWFNK